MNWPTVFLHDICRPKQWPTISTGVLKESGYPVYGANGKIGFYDQFTHKDPTVLITCRGATCGTINICEPYSYVNGNAMALDALDKKVDLNFLARYLQLRGLHDAISGSAQPQITREGLRGITVPLPPVEQQRRIAEILDKADALLQKRRLALQKLDALPIALFEDTFLSNGVGAENWKLRELGEILEFLTSGSRGWAEYYVDSGSKFLRIQNVRRDRLDLTDLAFVCAPSTQEAVRTKVRPGDVLLSITADLGRTAVVPDSIGDAYINQHLSILRTKAVDPVFLSSFLSSQEGQRQIQAKDRHGVKAGLNFDDVRSIKVPVPPPSLQSYYSATIRRIEEQRDASIAHSKGLECAFAALQHRAFQGEL